MEQKVKLIQYSQEAEKIVSSAAKLCYSSSTVDDIMDNLNEESVKKFLDMLMSYGHESPIEHVNFTFAIEGVSRSLTHQLVRHRLASYSQQSQRYVRLEQFDYIIPPEIERDEKAREIYISSMKASQKAYDELSDILKKKYISEGFTEVNAEKKAIEDARYVFPNSCETKIMVTMNARSLINFFRHRCCNRAQWEIRSLAEKMLIEVKKVAPTLFKYAGPSCIGGNCPEGKMTCGKIKEMQNRYLNIL
ncbi:FAD-dependent thymidylate synthase [Desnuesiella massiliensis]|uniref:FAD-dependent thymidylate synthase n=1 Tax=Desnuesiella massiliensis TaxID=1650662 RepID=UPI0006E267B5|nr:FAD-dependent thymidylate synthase [Desnuesiella massiliensis]